MENSEKIRKIKGTIKHYDWGGKHFLPKLLNITNGDKKPFAEYWLGDRAEAHFAKLPYLLKVLDVEKMLSIQVHPSKAVAQMKFREENEKGIPLDAPHRNYRDDNHKPELLTPLGEFYLLHGFKAEKLLTQTLKEVPELNFLEDIFHTNDYQRLYSAVMQMPQEEVNERLAPLLARIIPVYESGKISKDNPDFWAARAALSFNRNNNIDRGIFSIYFFNIVLMQKGEALFQHAGLPHAYLEGQTIEVMANSDNVLRGGLTPKHIDVPELLQQVRFEPTTPQLIAASLDGSKTSEQVFPTAADDFQLSRIIVKNGEGLSLPAKQTDIYFIYSGTVDASADEEHLSLFPGSAMLAIPGTVVHLAASTDAIVYRATEPIV